MTDTTTPPSGQTNVTVPGELQALYPDIIELILHSESMKDEERQYWINILPSMTPEQMQSLRDILENEKTQLAAIDAKYAAAATTTEPPQRQIEEIAAERTVRAQERRSQEEAARNQEEAEAESVLTQIDKGTL